jgi:hypothetical protein
MNDWSQLSSGGALACCLVYIALKWRNGVPIKPACPIAVDVKLWKYELAESIGLALAKELRPTLEEIAKSLDRLDRRLSKEGF